MQNQNLNLKNNIFRRELERFRSAVTRSSEQNQNSEADFSLTVRARSSLDMPERVLSAVIRFAPGFWAVLGVDQTDRGISEGGKRAQQQSETLLGFHFPLELLLVVLTFVRENAALRFSG